MHFGGDAIACFDQAPRIGLKQRRPILQLRSVHGSLAKDHSDDIDLEVRQIDAVARAGEGLTGCSAERVSHACRLTLDPPRK